MVVRRIPSVGGGVVAIQTTLYHVGEDPSKTPRESVKNESLKMNR
jgi:hypothetical protein